MKILKTKSSWFSKRDLRLDASFHLSEGRIAKIKVENCPHSVLPLNEITNEIFNGARFKRYYVEDKERGIPFMGSSDMLKSDLNGIKLISKSFSKNIDALTLQKNWTLVSCSGTIGNTVYANADFEGKTASQHIMRIVPNEKKIKSGYLYAYLTSKYGYALLTQGTYGAVIQHIEPHHLKDLPVPILPEAKQQEIHDLIVEAADLRVKGNKLLNEADDLFQSLNEIQYKPELITASENALQIGFVVKISSIFSKTIKARNHSLRAREIIKIWNMKEGIKFKNWISHEGLTRGTGGFFKRTSDPKVKGIDIVSQGDIHEFKPKFKQVIRKGIKDSEVAKTGMIILPSAGTLGENEIFLRPLLVYKNFEGKILSEVVGKLRPKNIQDSAYLYTALKSIGGFRILRALVYGTNLMYPNWDLLSDINIPCKSDFVKEKIASIVIDGFNKIAIAQDNEKKAISLIEQEIDAWQKS